MSIMKDSYMLTISKSIRSIVAMIVTMLAARIMAQNSFGTYKQMLLIFGFISGIVSAGLATSVSYYYKNISMERQKALVANSFVISFVISLIPAITLVVFRNVIARQFNNSSLSEYMPILAIYFFIITFFTFFENLFISQEKAKTLSIVNILYTIVYCLIVGLIIYLRQTVFLILFSMAIIELLRAMVLLIIHIHSKGITFHIDWIFLKEQLIYCIPLGLTYLLQNMNVYLDKLLISSYVTPETYGIYANGTAEIPFIGWFTLSVVTVALPTMSYMYNAENNKTGMFQLWGKLTKNTAIFLYPVFWVLLFYSQGYIDFLYSKKFVESVPIFIIFLMKLPLACTVFGNILIIMNRKKYIVYNMTLGILINVVLNYILINRFGMIGATTAAAVTQYILVILQLIQINRFSGIKFSKLLPYTELFKIFFVSGIAGGLVFVLSRIINLGDVKNLFIYGTFTFVLSLLMFLVTGIASVHDVLGRFKSKFLRNAADI